MRKIRNFFLLALLAFCVMHPQFVRSDDLEDRTLEISENIRNMSEFLREQEYYEDISKLCHEEDCFSVDIHDLERSLAVMEEKIIDQIALEFGSEQAMEAKLKGFSITRILTR